jgi:hypothetical protein
MAFALGGAEAGAVPVFSDNFDAETGSGNGASGQSKTNYTGFVSWTVSDGTVDLVAHTDFGIDCAGGSGKCVDLDGATNNAGVLTSLALNLAAGTYELSLLLAGTDAGFPNAAANTPNTVDISVGGFFALSVTLAKGDPFASYGGSFTLVAPAVVSIVIANQGGDNFGAMLDDVNLELVPEPGTALLVGLGVAGFGLSARRRARA